MIIARMARLYSGNERVLLKSVWFRKEGLKNNVFVFCTAAEAGRK
jgi:hypothetical protein